MMYYKTGLTRRVRVHPAHTGGGIKNLFQVVRKMLKQDIRKNCFNPEHGYIVDRISIEKIGDGYCLPNLGFIEYMVTFDAILLYPVVGECVDVVVEVVTDTCIIFRHACVYGVVRSYCLYEQDFFKYEERDVVPEGEKKHSGTFKEGLFRSETDSAKLIEKGTVVRVRITQRTLGGNGFFLIGSMSSQYLGPRKNPHPAPPMPETVGGKLATMPKLPFHEIGLTLEEIEKIEAQQRFEIAIGDDSDDVDEDDSDVSFASLTIDS